MSVRSKNLVLVYHTRLKKKKWAKSPNQWGLEYEVYHR